MITGFEHHGRLCRRDGRPANPGSYDLRFALHGEKEGKRACWTEDHTEINVAPGGFFSVVLGREKTIKPSYFERGERYLSVRVLRKGEAENECTARIPFTGGLVCLQAAQGSIKTRIESLEAEHDERCGQPSPAELAQTIESLDIRIRRLESERLTALEKIVSTLSSRLDAIDGDGQRMDRVEDRIEDIDGSDGDIVDLVERMHAVETVAPQLFDYLADENPAMELEALEERVRRLERDNLLQPQDLRPVQELHKAK